MQETWVQSLGWEDPWRREQLPLQYSGEFGLYGPWGYTEWNVMSHFHFHYSCFIMLCQFLLFDGVNQIYVYMYPLPLEPASLHIPPL